MGLGHTRRNLVLSAALEELVPEASILIATGISEADGLGRPQRTEILKLPSLEKVGSGQYMPRRLQVPMADLIALRADIMAATVHTYRPDVMLVDRHPLGIDGELRWALD